MVVEKEEQERDKEEEEKIINIRIFSDDFLKLFGLLIVVTNDFPSELKPIARDILDGIANRITKLNERNKEFIDTVQQ